MCMEGLDLISSAGPSAAEAATQAVGYAPGAMDLANLAGGVASDYAVGPGWSAIPSGGGGISLADVTNAIKPFIGPAATVGSMVYGANQQSKMGKDLAGAQGQSYQQYLNALNPPEEAKQAMFNKVNSEILSSSPVMMRKISNELASRGVRGQGTASPMAGAQRGVTDAQRKAYLDIYGRYNVPQALPPVNWAPGTSNILGKNASDIGSLMMMKSLFG